MNYKEARSYLDKIAKSGSILGLESIQALLQELDNPQDALKFIHIAGTNGKGSILAYVSTILSEAGYRIGRYISPTIVSYRERIQIDGQWISKDDLTELTQRIQKAIEKMKEKGLESPTVFEVETAIAFLYFKKKKCDVVVLETGLGGSLDATNIVKNTEVAVFASISRDHMGFLGDTLGEIARNKAGIIKPGCCVVSTYQKPEVECELKKKAEQLQCPVLEVNPNQVEVFEETWEQQSFLFDDQKITIHMIGGFQRENAMTAYTVIKALRKRGYVIDSDAVTRGFEKTQWIGRFTCIQKSPLFFVDGAHNEDAAQRLRETVESVLPNRRLVFIMGVFKDKEYKKIAQIMVPLATKVYTVNLPDENRTLDAQKLAIAVKPYCENVVAVDEIEKAVDLALDEAKEDDVILAFGSLSYLGRIIKYNAERM